MLSGVFIAGLTHARREGWVIKQFGEGPVGRGHLIGRHADTGCTIHNRVAYTTGIGSHDGLLAGAGFQIDNAVSFEVPVDKSWRMNIEIRGMEVSDELL